MRSFKLFLAALLAAAFALPAQEKPKMRENEDQAITTFKVEVNVVNLFFNVKDKHGGLVGGLTRDDFTVQEDGKPQTIKYFTAEASQPLTLGILIDTSGSQQRVLPMEQEVGGVFLNQVLRPTDLAFVLSFDVNVELLQDFTASTRDLRAALDRTRINTGGAVGSLPGLGGGPIPNPRPRGTLLYDAIYLAADEKLKHEVGRKAMIILTDGEDQGSQLRIRDAIEAAQKADAICYVILIADRGFYGGYGYSGDRQMSVLTEETGGRMIKVCLLYTSPSPRDLSTSRMPSSA